MNGYARWLVWLLGHQPAALTDPVGSRATEARVIAFLEEIHEEVAPRTLFGYACRLKRALQLMGPFADWSWFDPLLRELEPHARNARPARQGFVPSHHLFAYGVQLMTEAEARSGITDRVRAEAYRNGLMIAFLALRPLRLKNMIQLEIGTQLTETACGYDVRIPPDRTKTHNTLEFPVPQALVPAIGRYLRHYRPILAAGAADLGETTTDYAAPLWLARGGAQFPADTFADIITTKTQARFGVRLTPHEFRHCAATSIVEFSPEDYPIIQLILGHTTARTAETYYIRAKGMEAARLYQGVVKRRRKALARQVVAADPGPLPKRVKNRKNWARSQRPLDPSI